MISRICLCGISDTGNVRLENQDAILLNGIIERKEIEMNLCRDGLFFNRYGLLCAVADGIGGQKGGSMASHQVLRNLAEEMFFMGNCSEYNNVHDYLVKLVQRIHQFIVRQGEMNLHLAKMGTTLTGIYLRPEYGIFFHAGDSRLYRFRGDFLMQMTNDHVVENITAPSGVFALQGSKSGIITNGIGGGPLAKCWLETGPISLKQDEILILCSDGLSDMVSVEKIEEIVSNKRQNLLQAARDLVAAAKDGGGYDNISVILIGNQKTGR